MIRLILRLLAGFGRGKSKPRRYRPNPSYQDYKRRAREAARAQKERELARKPPQAVIVTATNIRLEVITTEPPPRRRISGRAYVIDGDTIVIKGQHIRLAGIDAPELDQPYGQAAKYAMARLCRDQIVTAELTEDTSYERLVAQCSLPDGTDLAAALVAQGLALDWAKFSGGRYRHLEPEGLRRKLWRVEAKHRGKLFIEIDE